MSDLEAKEEARLLRAMQGSGKTGAPKINAKRKTTAEIEKEYRAPASSDGEKKAEPAWKAKQRERERETAERLKREAAERERAAREKRERSGSAAVDESPITMNEASLEELSAQQILLKVSRGELDSEDPVVAKAMEAAQERIGSVFKNPHIARKHTWAKTAAQAAQLRADADRHNEEERTHYEAEQRAEHSAEQKKAAVIAARAKRAAAQQQAAVEHYASAGGSGGDDDEPFMNAFEEAVAEELLLLRTSPDLFAEKLKVKRLPRVCEGVLEIKDEDGVVVRMRLAEGVDAIEEAVKELAETPSLPELQPSAALTRAMWDSVQHNSDKPNALAKLSTYGSVSGGARQVKYRGPAGLSGEDAVLAVLTDDGNVSRSRRRGLLDAKYNHYGLCCGTTADGTANFVWLLLVEEFEAK